MDRAASPANSLTGSELRRLHPLNLSFERKKPRQPDIIVDMILSWQPDDGNRSIYWVSEAERQLHPEPSDHKTEFSEEAPMPEVHRSHSGVDEACSPLGEDEWETTEDEVESSGNESDSGGDEPDEPFAIYPQALGSDPIKQ